MIFTSVPTYALDGAYAGRLGLVPDEATALFDQIGNDLPVVLKATSTQ
jgi:hypothetical protein